MPVLRLLADFLEHVLHCYIYIKKKPLERESVISSCKTPFQSRPVCAQQAPCVVPLTTTINNQPLHLALSSGLFDTSRTSGHLLRICVPFKEICNPTLKSVCPHQRDENCLVSCLPLGCFYCSDRRRQVLTELLLLASDQLEGRPTGILAFTYCEEGTIWQTYLPS